MNDDCLYIRNHGYGKIGDTIVSEPAITALAEKEQRKVLFCVNFQNRHEDLYAGHPWIIPIRETIRDRTPDYEVNHSDAFHTAHARNIPFGAGFFNQLGMIHEGKRVHYRNYAIEEISRESLKDHACYDSIIIVQNGYSCASRDSTTGQLKQHTRPNVQPPQEWWLPVLESISKDRKIFSLSANSLWDFIKFDNIPNINNDSLFEVLRVLKAASLVMSVETGILHLLSATKTKTCFLSCATPSVFAKPDTRCEVVRAWFADELRTGDVIKAIYKLLEE